ncbi:MAG: flagellar export protein FliJ [bacterium]|nr:flagellar export protein FliJ [bacterium]
MKKFVFKLNSVLKYRETLESLAKNDYREALRLLNIEKDRLLELKKKREALKTAYDLKVGAVVSPEVLSFISIYSAQLLYLTGKQEETIFAHEKTAKEKFDTWNHRRKDVKVMKRLEEKKWKEYLREADKEEQKFQDEVFLAKTVRSMER